MLEFTNLRRTLQELKFDITTARTIEAAMFLWDDMFLSHPAFDDNGGSDPPIAINAWESLYADETEFKQAMPASPQRMEEIRIQIREADSLSALDGTEFDACSDLQQTPFAQFCRRVLGPYCAWHLTEPWADFRAACDGDDEALCRLLEIDSSVLKMQSIQRVWAVRLDEDRNLMESVRYATKRKLRDKVAGGESGENFEVATRKRLKLRLAAELQRWLEHRFRKHPDIAPQWDGRQKGKPNAGQIRQIFDAYASDTRKTKVDKDLPEFDDTLRKDIANYRQRIEKALEHQ